MKQFRSMIFKVEGVDANNSDNNVNVNTPIELQTGTLNDIAYLICPVVSNFGNSIIYAGNGPGPEFLPAKVLSLYPEARNGRPVVLNHPIDPISGEYVSANSSPEIIERYSFGFWQNCRFESNRIKGDLWLDEERAKVIGQEATDIIDSIKSGSIIEVSEGNFVLVDGKPGTYNGQDYIQSWTLAITDHIACLEKGVIGACGVVSHGCGAGNRMMSKGKRKTLLKPMIVGSNRSFDSPIYPKGGQRYMGFTSAIRTFLRGERGQIKNEHKRFQMFVSDLSSKLSTALSSEEEGYSWIEDFDPDKGIVIFWIIVSYGYFSDDYERKLFQRSYTLNGETIILGNDRIEVELGPTVYVPVGQRTGDNSTSTVTETPVTVELENRSGSRVACSCKDKEVVTESQSTTINEEANGTMGNINIPNATSEEVTWLESLQVEGIRSLRSLAIRVQQEESQRRDGLITSLVGSQTAFGKQELEVMTLDQLTRLSTLAKERNGQQGQGPTRIEQHDYSNSRPALDQTSRHTRSAQLPDPLGLNKVKGVAN